MSVCIIIAILMTVGSGGIKANGDAAEVRRVHLIYQAAQAATVMALVFGLLVLERGWP